MRPVIGIDFDNTIASYDDIFHRIALVRGLIAQEVPKSKKEIRDRIRELPDGETEWQRLQAVVYGPKMEEARLISGVREFFRMSRQRHFRVFIVSHKTEFANHAETRISLRQAALLWMRGNGFFENSGFGLSQNDVYFESSRQEKIDRIQKLRCTHFIDDLAEIFQEATFPLGVEKLLFSPDHPANCSVADTHVMRTWDDIGTYFFGGKT